MSKGLIVSSPREALDALPARGAEGKTDEIPLSGYDIWLLKDEGRFKFERYDSGKLAATKFMDRTRIDTYEEW